jgi:uncharacterized MnhB-related membrane protein
MILDAAENLVMLLAAVAAAGVVRTRDSFAQAVAVGASWLLLALLFVLFQGPDVALSQLAVGAVAMPLMIVLALKKIRRDRARKR